jgi:hypothetical protein
LRLAQPFGAPADMSLMAAIAELVAIGGHAEGEEDDCESDLLTPLLDERLRVRDNIKQIGVIRTKLNQQLAKFEVALNEIASDALKRRLIRHGNVVSSEDIQVALKSVTACCGSRSFWQRIIDFLLRRNIAIQVESTARKLDAQFRQWLDPEGQWPSAPSVNNPNALQFFQQALRFLQPLALANDHLVEIDLQRQELEDLPSLEHALSRQLALAKEIEILSVERLKAKARSVGAGLTEVERTRLSEVLAANRNRSNLDSEADEQRLSRAMRKVYPILLEHFPLAATTNLSVGRDIPLEPGLFDLVVVDEASQCDIASVIPLLFRARRAIVLVQPNLWKRVSGLAY